MSRPLLAQSVVGWPLVARAQQSEQIRRIGVLMNIGVDDPEGRARIAAFLQGLQQLGWTDGRNVRVDTCWAGGSAAVAQKYAVELVALPIREADISTFAVSQCAIVVP